MEVSNQLSKIHNPQKSYNLKSQQVDALESKLELTDTKKEQLNAAVHVYRDLGFG